MPNPFENYDNMDNEEKRAFDKYCLLTENIINDMQEMPNLLVMTLFGASMYTLADKMGETPNEFLQNILDNIPEDSWREGMLGFQSLLAHKDDN